MVANVWRTVEFLLLGDDVGIGKTVSAICGLSRGEALPSLVTLNRIHSARTPEHRELV